MKIEIELIGNSSDKYEITTQILDILLKTSADIGYSYQSTNEDGKVAVTSRKLHKAKFSKKEEEYYDFMENVNWNEYEKSMNGYSNGYWDKVGREHEAEKIDDQ